MKKLLYLVPLVLLVLNFLPMSLYKDTVNYGSSLDTLSPSHWKPRNLEVSFSASVGEAVASGNTGGSAGALSDGATFRGFPAGAYFSRSSDTNTPGVRSSLNVSAWSWLWAGVDGLLLLVSLVVAFLVNRRSKISTYS